tara:strand:- start:1737 stop:3071 length:1335 start_codon:yes stop_codon:yes gene_type:complete
MKVLIVTTAFYPEQAIGCVRVTKLAKYLDAAGVEVSVVSKSVGDDLPQDRMLHFDALDRMNWITVDQSSLFKSLFTRVYKNITEGRGGLSLMEAANTKPSLKARIMRYFQLGFTLLKGADWAREVLKRVRAEMPNKTFDVVLASYPSYGSPMAGNALVQAGFARKLVIDFRDPMAYGGQSSVGLDKLNRYLQTRFIGCADAALFVSLGVQMMVSETSDITQKHILSNGFDPDDARDQTHYNTSKDKLVFCYVGTLYGGKRDLSIFFRVLNSMIISGALDSDSVELKYAGRDFGIIFQQAHLEGAESILTDCGFVTRDESMALQRSSDVCLVSTWNDEHDQGILTGKIFEYFLFHKPVIAVVAGTVPNSEMKKVVSATGAGVTVELASQYFSDEIAVLKDFIKRIYDEKSASGHVVNIYNDSVKDFGYPRLGVNLRDILVNLVEE